MEAGESGPKNNIGLVPQKESGGEGVTLSLGALTPVRLLQSLADSPR